MIVINAAIGFFTEWKAAHALSALQKQSVRLAHVVRDGKESEIPAAELVCGSLVVLVAGARLPADGRIVLTVFIALMIGWPLPLVALQILWLNLITDIFPAFALALEPSAPNVMKCPPRDPKESLLPLRFIILMVW